jgi:hypothetical protein
MKKAMIDLSVQGAHPKTENFAYLHWTTICHQLADSLLADRSIETVLNMFDFQNGTSLNPSGIFEDIKQQNLQEMPLAIVARVDVTPFNILMGLNINHSTIALNLLLEKLSQLQNYDSEQLGVDEVIIRSAKKDCIEIPGMSIGMNSVLMCLYLIVCDLMIKKRSMNYNINDTTWKMNLWQRAYNTIQDGTLLFYFARFNVLTLERIELIAEAGYWKILVDSDLHRTLTEEEARDGYTRNQVEREVYHELLTPLMERFIRPASAIQVKLLACLNKIHNNILDPYGSNVIHN